MNKYDNVKEFLNSPNIQGYLQEENMNEIFEIWLNTYHQNYQILIEFFETECGINPLAFMDYLPYGYFYHNKANELHIPDGITDLCPNSIYGCKNLETIYLPNSITFLQEDAISNCPNLKYIVYEGTKSDFQNLQLEDFTEGEKVIIQCDDGDINWNDEDFEWE